MLQYLEATDLTAKLLPRLQILHGQLVHNRHRADSLGAECRDRLVNDALDQRQARPCLAEHILRPDPHPGQCYLSRPQPILCGITAARHTICLGVHEKHADAVAIPLPPANPSSHDELVGAVAVQHHPLFPVEQPSGATVRTRKGDVTGVIASKPPHLLSADERERVVKMDSMFIDIGATGKESAEKEFGVRIGDPIAPLSDFIRRGKNIVMGKAFDDRIGTFVGLEVLKRMKTEKVQHPNTVFVAGTVQEEVGLRGAQTVANLVGPDVAFALEVDIAGDVPGIRPQDAPSKMGRGASVLTFDMSMIPNQGLKSLVIETAEKDRIPYQLSTVKGGTDAGRFTVNATGCPSIVLSVPTRHIHSHTAIADLADVDSVIRLVVALIKRLDARTVEGFTRL